MKKFNLIERLLSYSHEKQSPQRFARYAAMLIMLLTLSVGQMWAGDTYRIYLKPTSQWDGGSAKFSIHYWTTAGGHSAEDKWMVKDGDYYYYDVPTWANKLIFIRNTNTATNAGFTDYWAQTATLDCPSSRIYEISSHGDGYHPTSSGSWKNIWLGARTVYIDANNLGWDKTISSGPYLRIGRNSTDAGSTSAYQMTKVANTSNLYKHYQSSDWSNYTCYAITNAQGWTNDKSVYDTHGLTFSTGRNQVSVVTDITIIPKFPGIANGYEYGGNYITRYDNHLYDEGLLKYNLNLTKNGNGTIEIYAPIDGDGTMHNFTNEDGYTVPSGNIHIDATPADGYELTSLTANGGVLKNDEGYGYTFYYNNVTQTMPIVATFTKIENKKIYIYDSGNWKNARGKLFIHAWNKTMSTDNGFGNYGPELKALGNGWYEATISTAYSHFMISDSTETHKSSDRTVADYVDGGRYSTESGDIPSYSASDPTAVYVEVIKGGKKYLSNTVTAANDTLSFFCPSSPTSVKLHYFSSGLQSVDLTTDFSSVQDNVITAEWNGTYTATALANLDVYDQDYNIHVYATTENYLLYGKSRYGTTGTKFIKFEKNVSIFGDTYSYYWVDWFPGSQSVVATVGNKFHDDLAGVIAADANAPGGKTTSSGGNVRFGYDPTTNYFIRAIITGNGEDVKIKADVAGTVTIGGNDAYAEARSFSDATNWVYTVDATVKGQSTASVQTTYNGNLQILLESKKLLGGVSGTPYTVMLSYDLKTNRVIAAWNPEGQDIDYKFDLESNLMVVRVENGAPTVLNVSSSGDIHDIAQIYTVLEITKANWTKSGGNADRRIVTPGSPSFIDEYYWISLPYECKVSDIFGIPNYGSGDYDHWVLQTYRGDLRAQSGWWAETDAWWYDLERTDTLKANEGYVLRLTNLETVFPSGEDTKLYLYFPSANSDLTIAPLGESVTTKLDSMRCHVWRKWAGDPSGKQGEHNPIFDRRAVDSNWRVIGSPSFNSTKVSAPEFITDEIDNNPADGYISLAEQQAAIEKYIEEHDGATPYSLKYFYNWAVVDGTPKFSIANAAETEFIATHAHLVQYEGEITWVPYDTDPLVGISAAPARKNSNELSLEQTLRLVLKKDAQEADVAFISRMAFGATTGYDVNMDLSKMTNANSANIYTYGDLYKMAGNCLPDTISTIQVGVQLATAGDYTFAMPDGTYGTGVVLVDNVANTRTNLALTDYTVTLPEGETNERFYLELSPIAQTPTDIEQLPIANDQLSVKKVMVDGILYIVKDGKVYDAQGNRVK